MRFSEDIDRYVSTDRVIDIALMLFPASENIVRRANTYIEPWVAVDWTEIRKIVKEFSLREQKPEMSSIFI